MTFLDASSLKRISKTHQVIKMMKRAGYSNKTKTKNGFLQIIIIQ